MNKLLKKLGSYVYVGTKVIGGSVSLLIFLTVFIICFVAARLTEILNYCFNAIADYKISLSAALAANLAATFGWHTEEDSKDYFICDSCHCKIKAQAEAEKTKASFLQQKNGNYE